MIEVEEEVTKEQKLKDGRRNGRLIREKTWFKRERQESINRLPNEFRSQGRDVYDHFNYLGD